MSRILVASLVLLVASAAPAQLAGHDPGGIGGPVTSPGQAAPHLQSVERILAEVAWRTVDGGAPPAHVHAGERCLRPFLSRVRDSALAFTPAEREWVSARSPQLALAVERGLQRAGVLESTSGLPSFPSLSNTLEGKDCVLHYTLTGPNASPDIAYVKAVRKQVDAALKKMTKAMKRPYYEPDRDGVDKLHVFVADLDLLPDLDEALGFVQGVSSVPGSLNDKAETVYMAIDTGLRGHADAVGMPWKKLVKATAFHEAMHCYQAAYNSFMSGWAQEGQATWAELAYGKVVDSLQDYLEGAQSIFTAPELPLWHDSIHQYSTAPLFAYLEWRLGKGANTLFLDESPNANDGVSILANLLIVEEFVLFDDFYAPYIARLYAKDIPRLPKKAVPDMAVTDVVDQYGFDTTGSVEKTGVHVYRLDVPAGLKTDLLFSRVSEPPGEGADTTPSGVVVHGKNKRLRLFPGSWDVVDGFKGNSGAALLVTDMDLDGQSFGMTSYRAEVFAPHIEVTDVEIDSPITAGSSATTTFTYDLLGVPDEATFPVILFRGVKGPNTKSEENLFLSWEPGAGMQATVPYFPFGGKGTYNFKFTAKTPPDSYGGGHMKSKAKTKLKVVAP